MNGAELLARARVAGLRLALEPDGAIAFEADQEPPPELLAELRAHRDAIATLLEAEHDLERAAHALAVVEPDPALLEEGVIAPADPVEPILDWLELGELEAAAEALAATARVHLDPITWRELEALARACPSRCRRALEAVLARDPKALDAVLDAAAGAGGTAEEAELEPLLVAVFNGKLADEEP